MQSFTGLTTEFSVQLHVWQLPSMSSQFVWLRYPKNDKLNKKCDNLTKNFGIYSCIFCDILIFFRTYHDTYLSCIKNEYLTSLINIFVTIYL